MCLYRTIDRLDIKIPPYHHWPGGIEQTTNDLKVKMTTKVVLIIKIMDMELNDWVILISALGGIEGVKQLVKFWLSRKTNARIEDARADVEEFKALREYNEFLQKQLSEKEERFVEQTSRLRTVQDELFSLKEDNSNLKLELALKRCEKKKCGDRIPQNGY